MVTGVAGFIGYHLAAAILDSGRAVLGIDNLNEYYDPALKAARLGLMINYDDGFVAYLNGKEVLRRNVKGSGASATVSSHEAPMTAFSIGTVISASTSSVESPGASV